MNSTKVITLPIDKIQADIKNPRQEFSPPEMRRLEESIKKQGILTPLMVEENNDGTYLLVDGERRFRASKKLAFKEVPVIVMPAMDESERLIARFQLQEQHSQWTAWEKAQAMAQFQNTMGLTNGEVADALGLSRSQVQKYVEIARMSKRTSQSIAERKLPFDYLVRIARVIRGIKDSPEIRQDLENALIDKIDRKLILKAGDISKYSQAVNAGHEKIARKIISKPNYTPQEAQNDAGTSVQEHVTEMMTGLGHIINVGPSLVADKNLVFSEKNHIKVMAAKKILEKLEDVDFEKGTMRRSNKVTVD